MSCHVDGCSGEVWSRGWCRAHWTRWRRHGDPLAGRRSPGALPELLLSLVTSETDACLVWPAENCNRYGYPQIKWQGATRRANRVSCEMKHGPAPTDKHHAAHSCGNRACVNPRHLRWATGSENQMDRIKHGTDCRGEKNVTSKVTASMVRDIRRFWATGDVSQLEISREFGITQSAVSSIVTGKNWGWLQ